MTTVGGLRDIGGGSANTSNINDLAKFAVDHHNSNQNALLEFHRVVETKEQTVAGTVYHITLEASDGGKKNHYATKVWVKPWMNFKEVQEFNHIGEAPA